MLKRSAAIKISRCRSASASRSRWSPRVNALSASSAVDVLAELLELLAQKGIAPVALTGGVAFGVWVTPRHTNDFDLCVVVSDTKSVDKLMARYDGHRTGPSEIPSIMSFSFRGWEVNLFVASGAYERCAIARAKNTTLLGLPVKVVAVEDLLIQKLIKLRSDKHKILQDAADIRALVDAYPDRDIAHLRSWLPADEATLLEEAGRITPAELVSRLEAVGLRSG
ncbi:MAG: hypothetical protein ACT4TC_07170 [Myxococcaceae bacterium]